MRRILFACAVIMTAKTCNAINLEADSMLEVAAFAQPGKDTVIEEVHAEVERIGEALSGLEDELKALRADLEATQ